jgi:hypothetical protein
LPDYLDGKIVECGPAGCRPFPHHSEYPSLQQETDTERAGEHRERLQPMAPVHDESCDIGLQKSSFVAS